MVQDSNTATTPDKASTTATGDLSSDEKRKKVGNYVILKTIGEGSFAKVRLGVHLITEMRVAVKVINKREVFKRNYLRANLRREASMMQRMSHKNIVQLHEVMETENSYYIVMDLVQGNEFVKYLTKKKQLDELETRKYIRQIVSAVDHMHRARVIHRDIKLQNFMLDQNNDIIIIDFGLSNCLDEKGFLTTQCGSPAYAAPEIFAHQEYGPAVDVWSIGVNMYAMLLGKLPFKVEHRSRNLAKLHACILKGCEIPTTLSRGNEKYHYIVSIVFEMYLFCSDCQDLLTRLLEPSPTKRITMAEILRHPFLINQLGPIELMPYKPQADAREINRNITKYLAIKHGYSEHDVEDAVIYRKPIASRALYNLIERRLKQGLSWPDPTYNHTINIHSSLSTTGDATLHDGSPDVIVLDKLVHNEPLLPGRRVPSHLLPQQTNSIPTNGRRLSRDKSNYGFDEHVILHTNTNGNIITGGLTQEAYNELVPTSKATSRKLFHDIIMRKPSAIGNSVDLTDEHNNIKRTQNSSGLTLMKPLVTGHRSNVISPHAHPQQQQHQQQQHKMKPRSLPNSTLDHANQNGFHLPHDPLASGTRTPKPLSRASNVEHMKRSQQHSPVRYNPAPSVTVKAIGLFLKNSALHSRISSSSSKSSKNVESVSPTTQQQSPPLRFYPSTSNTSNTNKSNVINYHSHGNLTSASTTRQAFAKSSESPHHISPSKTQHSTTTTGTNGQKLMQT
ncbi:unnamed protein product [Adineta steineri]|uniref:non-specific serine/threonine protein kinase n=1 Tax=Adineta steineri TaxID=433720 RepID=A0A818YFJ7_9BILA|nr:unnamed protein product [Adineta steineri]CAF1113299.1 unnamed protein product [Adineta steineri]CAF3582387.1 unnamed protein product [Adineta steineri]CAF3749442.1 unnamed protein product [Adineta steineri]